MVIGQMVSCGQTAGEFTLLYYTAERTRLAKLAAERNDSEGWGKSMLQWPKKFWESGEERDASSGFYAGRREANMPAAVLCAIRFPVKKISFFLRCVLSLCTFKFACVALGKKRKRTKKFAFRASFLFPTLLLYNREEEEGGNVAQQQARCTKTESFSHAICKKFSTFPSFSSPVFSDFSPFLPFSREGIGQRERKSVQI